MSGVDIRSPEAPMADQIHLPATPEEEKRLGLADMPRKERVYEVWADEGWCSACLARDCKVVHMGYREGTNAAICETCLTRANAAMREPLVTCTCFMVSAWQDPCPRHGALPGQDPPPPPISGGTP